MENVDLSGQNIKVRKVCNNCKRKFYEMNMIKVRFLPDMRMNFDKWFCKNCYSDFIKNPFKIVSNDSILSNKYYKKG